MRFFMCIYIKTAIWLFFGPGRSGFFWWIQVGNPA